MTKQWLLQALFDRCHAEASSLGQRSSTAALEAADRFQPGQQGRDAHSPHSWAIYHVALKLAAAKLDAETSPAKNIEVDTARRFLDVLMEKPVAVGSLGVLKVFPKSLASISYLNGLGAALKPLEEQIDKLSRVAPTHESWRASVEEQLSALYADRDRICGVIVWCTTYPSPSLPFTDTTAMPDPPQYMRELGTEVYAQIAAAHRDLHTERINFCDSLLPVSRFRVAGGLNDPTADPSRFDELIAQLSEWTGISRDVLYREHSLPSAIGLVVVANEMKPAPPGQGIGLVS